MTNLNDTETELEHAVGIDSQRKISITGAGANAISKANMMSYGGHNSLAELVWSPQTGLAIKFAEKEPCFSCEDGSSNVRFLQSEDTRVSAEVKTSGSVEIPGNTCNVHTSPQNEGTEDHDKLSKRLFEDKMTTGVNGLGSNSKPPLEFDATDQCGPQEQLEIVNLEVDDSDPLLENRKGSIFKNKNITERGDSLPCEDNNGSLHCQDNNDEHEVESRGSLESCRSVNLLTKVNKRKSRFEQQLMFKSKRIKKLADECMVKKDGSFMSWISNMLKGLENHESYDRKIGIREETKSFQRKKTGFQTVFRSLYSQDSRAHETIARMQNNSVCRLKERVIMDKKIKEKKADGLEKNVSLYERITKEAPKEMFDIIRRLRLSRTDILKWANSQSSFANLDGYFVRLRLAKTEEGSRGSRYYVACITGLQGENTWKGVKQRIRVIIGGVECFVESQHISNCDFIEDELVAWWQKTSTNGGTPLMKDLKSKLMERTTLGL